MKIIILLLCLFSNSLFAQDSGVSSVDVLNIDRANICKTNPDISICKISKYDYAAGICDGDAVACATAKTLDDIKKLYDADAVIKAAGESALASAVVASSALAGSTTNISDMMTLNSAGDFGMTTGTCPASKQIVIFEQSFSFGYDYICQYSNVFRAMTIVSSIIFAMSIIFREV